MNCREFRRQHLDYSDLTLSAADHAEAQAHVEGCAACARFDAGVRRSLLLVHNLPAVPVGAASPPSVVARIARARAGAMSAQRPRRSPGRLMVAAASVAFLAGLYSTSLVPPRARARELTLAPVVAMAAPIEHLDARTMIVRLELTPDGSATSPLWPATSVVRATPAHFVSAAPTTFPPR